MPLTEEDHRFISERLPALIAAESKPAKQEEKEKHKKIAKIKAGDPKDMTVILLREVLMEIGVSFKSSESKANLIEKVTQARQMQNGTCDDNGLVTVTSTDSLNLHTEELREVPENSISSLFFHKNNALSSSSGTLLRARGKITLDTQELNVHEHLIIYFDFLSKEQDNFIVAFTISPFYHSSKMLPNVQYTNARSPLTLLFTVNCPR